jgi:hypothetical protein
MMGREIPSSLSANHRGPSYQPRPSAYPPGPECLAKGSGGQYRESLQGAAQLIRPVPGKKTPVSLEDLPLHQHQLSLQCPQSFHCCLRYTLIHPVMDEPEQPLYTVAADPGDATQLGQVSADCIDQRRALAHEQLPGPVQHQQ